jgi:uncharacterized membrane protein
MKMNKFTHMMKTPAAHPDKDPYEDLDGNPILSDVVENNIRSMLRLSAQRLRERTLQDRMADGITFISGRMPFVYFHAIWFAAWIVLNTGHAGVKIFDPYPYGFLTMIVSLEAIFLSTFVLISQNRLSAEADRRADLDVHIGLLNEAKMTYALTMLHSIQKKLDIGTDDDPALLDFLMETSPAEVMAEIARVQSHVGR